MRRFSLLAHYERKIYLEVLSDLKQNSISFPIIQCARDDWFAGVSSVPIKKHEQSCGYSTAMKIATKYGRVKILKWFQTYVGWYMDSDLLFDAVEAGHYGVVRGVLKGILELDLDATYNTCLLVNYMFRHACRYDQLRLAFVLMTKERSAYHTGRINLESTLLDAASRDKVKILKLIVLSVTRTGVPIQSLPLDVALDRTAFHGRGKSMKYLLKIISSMTLKKVISSALTIATEGGFVKCVKLLKRKVSQLFKCRTLVPVSQLEFS